MRHRCHIDFSGTLVRVLSTPGKAKLCRFALDVGIRALDFYEDFFEIAYPLPKMDMIAIPDFAMGAMENWGLVTYRDRKSASNRFFRDF